MTRYVVILQASLHGSPAGSTRDVVDADDAAAAEAKAIEAWTKADPRCSYRPLLTTRST